MFFTKTGDVVRKCVYSGKGGEKVRFKVSVIATIKEAYNLACA